MGIKLQICCSRDRRLGWTSLQSGRKIARLTMMYKIKPQICCSRDRHLGWTCLQSWRKIARLTMMYKILNNMAQVDFGRLHKTQEPKVRAPTKRDRRAHSKQLARVQCLRNYRRHSCLPRTIPDCNDSLPETVPGATSLDVFTSGVRKLHQ